MGKVIAVSDKKGGILKSSMVANLSGVLAKTGKKILIIDTDSQSNIMLSFGKNADKIENTLYDVLVDEFPIEDTIVCVYPNIDVVPVNDDLNYFDMDVLENPEKYPNKFGLLKAGMKNIADSYDYVFIDTPPTLSLITGNVYAASEDVIIPFHPETFTVRSMVKTIQAVNNFREDNSKLNVKAIVPTKVKPKTRIHSANILSCREFCSVQGIPVTESYIRETIRYADVLATERLPLTLVEGEEAIYAEDYVKLVEELKY
jgi:chromosome partitioning protein